MMDKEVRPNYTGKIIASLILATLVFIMIFFLGYKISYDKYQSVMQQQESLRYGLLSFEVEKEIMGDSCDSFDPYRFSKEMEDMGRIISLLEERLGKNNVQVLEQKKVYSLLEARHFLYLQEFNNKCNTNLDIVLFFYSNKEEDKDRSDKLGFMLSSLKGRNSNLMVYSFDYYLDSSLISLMKNKYKVDAPNRLVINGKALMNSFNSAEEIAQYL
jgi:hypothetical protein